MTHKLITFLTFSILTLSATAQNKTFTVAAMNVDGLPKEINLGIRKISLNPDAKGGDGAKAISQKLATKDYDIIGLSEDFNYHGSLMTAIGDKYYAGTHRESIDAGTIAKALLNDNTFDTDGLGLLWKKELNVGSEFWTRWNQWNGKFDQGADGLIKKGFRYYLANFGDDVLVDIYILHMDAETNDGDLAARESQMGQLADDILRINPSKRPKIVMGDTNCRYTRDRLKTLFIDVINADGRYEIKDAWVEKCKSNTYPTYGTHDLWVDDLGYKEGEIVDKIFYINPKYGMQLRLNKFFVDTDFNDDNGEPLADHYPVVANFTTRGTLYDPASYWSGEYNTEYQVYAEMYNRLLPLTASSLQLIREQLPALLTEHVSAGSDIVERMKSFLHDFTLFMQENYEANDNTSRIKNPSFEEGVRLQTGQVQGWTVAPDVEEAFISGVIDNDEGKAIRNFNPHDGDYVFNTWGGYPANGFYCRQKLSLPLGWYLFSAVLATDYENSVYLRFGDYRESTGPQTDRTRGQCINIIGYHPGGSIIIGAESNGWFEADDFRLSHLVYSPTGIESVETDNASTLNPQLSTVYTLDGCILSAPRRGLNIIRRPDGTTQKLLVR